MDSATIDDWGRVLQGLVPFSVLRLQDVCAFRDSTGLAVQIQTREYCLEAVYLLLGRQGRHLDSPSTNLVGTVDEESVTNSREPVGSLAQFLGEDNLSRDLVGDEILPTICCIIVRRSRR